jgi:hypothetical protein
MMFGLIPAFDCGFEAVELCIDSTSDVMTISQKDYVCAIAKTCLKNDSLIILLDLNEIFFINDLIIIHTCGHCFIFLFSTKRKKQSWEHRLKR